MLLDGKVNGKAVKQPERGSIWKAPLSVGLFSLCRNELSRDGSH